MLLLFVVYFLDLVFYFVDELLPEQTPESVHLMAQGD